MDKRMMKKENPHNMLYSGHFQYFGLPQAQHKPKYWKRRI